eukprot:COSAG01_NODE_5487_length_4230_cov_2.227548_3_plen_540_part_01
MPASEDPELAESVQGAGWSRPFLRVGPSVTPAGLAGLLDGLCLQQRKPALLLSVLGATHDLLDVSAPTVAAIAHDIVTATQTFRALVITAGSATGASGLIGHAFHAHNVRYGQELNCLAFSTHTRVAGPALSRIKGPDGPEHLRFAVVEPDSGGGGGGGGGGVGTALPPPELRGHLHFILARATEQSAARLRARTERAYCELHQTPYMTVIVGGDASCLRPVQSAILGSDHVFVFKGSGGIADAIARIYEHSSSSSATLQQQQQQSDVRQQLARDPIFSMHIQALLKICNAARRKGNLSVVSPSDSSSEGMAHMLLKDALLHACATTTAATQAWSDRAGGGTPKSKLSGVGDPASPARGVSALSGGVASRLHHFSGLWKQFISRLVRISAFDFIHNVMKELIASVEGAAAHMVGREAQLLQLQELVKFLLLVVLRSRNAANPRQRAELVESLLDVGESLDRTTAGRCRWLLRDFIDLNELYCARRQVMAGLAEAHHHRSDDGTTPEGAMINHSSLGRQQSAAARPASPSLEYQHLLSKQH